MENYILLYNISQSLTVDLGKQTLAEILFVDNGYGITR